MQRMDADHHFVMFAFAKPQWLAGGDDGDVDVHVTIVNTQPITRFERAKLIGHRAAQLAAGDAPRAHCRSGSTQPLDVAAAEVDAFQLPAIRVIRYLPDGTPVQLPFAALAHVRPPVRC
jgi:DNA-directed RNA polymerase subunit K/omega